MAPGSAKGGSCTACGGCGGRGGRGGGPATTTAATTGDRNPTGDEGGGGGDPYLLAVLREALTIEGEQEVVGYDVLQEIVQENAVGMKLRVRLAPPPAAAPPRNDEEGGGGGAPAEAGSSPIHRAVFVKRVRLGDYLRKKRDWPDLRRTLLYARTEARFYREILPRLLAAAASGSGDGAAPPPTPRAWTPRVHLARCDLGGWIGDGELASDPAGADYPVELDESLTQHPNGDPLHSQKGGWIVMECVPVTDPDNHAASDADESSATGRGGIGGGGGRCLRRRCYYQDSPLSPGESWECLKAAAQMHAAAWEDRDLLEACRTRLSRASFHLGMRNPRELDGIVDSWKGFYEAFLPHLERGGLASRSCADLGRRLRRVAGWVSEQVSPGPSDRHATLIHGDYKALNVFLPIDVGGGGDEEPEGCLLVDFASTGVGLGMSDLAMHIHHAVLPEHLADGGEERLVRRYWEHLISLLPRNKDYDEADGASSASCDYPWEAAWRHYKLAVVDYLRFFVGRMWKSATPATMKEKEGNKNVSLINRSVPAAVAFLRVAEQFLTEVEAEYEAARGA